ncbi:hypothetical protein SFRURICE_008279 [Spodoptera frugiperda]|nr:hypothetical protein SFRURICE_008279 [Spodoptera frugiperda]
MQTLFHNYTEYFVIRQSICNFQSKSKYLFQLILNKALLKRRIELSVSLSVSEARRSFQSVASNGEERARLHRYSFKKKFFTISLIHYLSIVYICRNNVTICEASNL